MTLRSALRSSLLTWFLLGAPDALSQQYVASRNVNLRPLPSTARRELRLLPAGTPLCVLVPNTVNGFIGVVTTAGEAGWVIATHVTAAPGVQPARALERVDERWTCAPPKAGAPTVARHDTVFLPPPKRGAARLGPVQFEELPDWLLATAFFVVAALAAGAVLLVPRALRRSVSELRQAASNVTRSVVLSLLGAGLLAGLSVAFPLGMLFRGDAAEEIPRDATADTAVVRDTAGVGPLAVAETVTVHDTVFAEAPAPVTGSWLVPAILGATVAALVLALAFWWHSGWPWLTARNAAKDVGPPGAAELPQRGLAQAVDRGQPISVAPRPRRLSPYDQAVRESARAVVDTADSDALARHLARFIADEFHDFGSRPPLVRKVIAELRHTRRASSPESVGVLVAALEGHGRYIDDTTSETRSAPLPAQANLPGHADGSPDELHTSDGPHDDGVSKADNGSGDRGDETADRAAPKERYEFFKLLYTEEERRYEQLEGRAKLYLSVIVVFIAAVLLKAQEVKASATALEVPWWLIVVEAVALATALLFVVMAALIRTYEGITDPRDVIKQFGARPPGTEEFFTHRIADFTVATERNVRANDRAARLLSVAGVVLALAMGGLIAVFVVALRH